MEREGENHQCVVASHTPSAHWGPGLQPGMCPDRESNCNPVVRRLVFNPQSHTSQGYFVFLLV